MLANLFGAMEAIDVDPESEVAAVKTMFGREENNKITRIKGIHRAGDDRQRQQRLSDGKTQKE